MAKKWVANCGKEDEAEYAKMLTEGNPGRIIAAGDPKATPKYALAQLKEFGMIGLYEVAKGEPT